MSNVHVKQSSRLNDLINYKLRVITQDGRVYIGELLAFDKYMNLILSDCVEERIPKTQLPKLRNKVQDSIKIEKRVLGLTILRGEHVLTTVVEDKPLLSKKERVALLNNQKKKVQKNKKQNKNKNKVSKDSTTNKSASASVSSGSRFNSSGNNAQTGVPRQTKTFQPPPGFKRR
ncbi:mRNA splicing protein SMB1 NDAI_0B06030 [Naumovozyma dairenensis CBS 421]|uniref:Sm protein B n=1 Tax=Naumovozyma dairenensis (strain ATCC 10597 / BCRC 20456 / CBS 421 / NBRC 0211 / NRRL Y-12639) TaxID=1071378 RepID=G0W774_NAUDC|nr:hypothetical protein NDAI_0B06030 [Naumovozyma dairenensis CBS 421]CCD23635.1 hypothetical protein NDAI_0B06030 [Naumovozyma dairenensis CBS 421]